MEKQTISHLNNKMWYRLLKVIYVIVFIFSCGIAISIAFESVGNYQDDYTIVCNYGNKDTFLANNDKNIYISSYYDYTENLTRLPNEIKEELQSACGISKEEMTAKMARIFNGNDDSKKLFDITKTKVVTDTYLTASLWSILSILIIAIIMEIIKRIFYYIVLGEIKPQK